jgi:hypothetical protein
MAPKKLIIKPKLITSTSTSTSPPQKDETIKPSSESEGHTMTLRPKLKLKVKPKVVAKDDIDNKKDIKLESAVVIQKWIRRFLVKRKVLIPSSYYQTKKWRKNRKWYKNGKSNECEIYQRKMIEKITDSKCPKTKYRLHIENNELIEKSNPLASEDGFDYTEDFDGLQEHSNTQYFYNLKFVCNRGGAQTRTLREVYHFIKAQLEYLLKHYEPKDEDSKDSKTKSKSENDTKTKDICFVNILDGDESYKNSDKFKYLLKKTKYASLNEHIFVGDMKEFQEWFISESK